ncbi:tape measure protein [Paracoccus sp. p4-l81]|uniref:tape measure protein n=1 Tax=Paracoccus sp. p4-l81 TaxID=3342806 RepID=UPI0035B6B07A
MTDFAVLGFKGDATGLKSARDAIKDVAEKAKEAKKASDALGDGMGQAGAQAKRATDQIKAGATGATQAVERLGVASKAAAGAMNVLKSFAAGFAGALGLRALGQMADAWSDMSSRVGLAVGDMGRATEVMDRLQKMARQTYSPLSQTAEAFIANSTALRELGLNTQQQLDYTEALNNAFVVSGAKGDRAASVSNALSKAMAGGALRGDELNTVIQTGGRVAELLAAKLGTTTNGLRALGADGKITSAIIYDALVGAMETLREEAASMPATIADGFTLLGNAVLTMVGQFDQAIGVSGALATVLVGAADNLDVLAVAILAVAVTQLPKLVTYLHSTIARFAALSVAGGPLGIALGAVTAIIGGLVAWRGRVDDTNARMEAHAKTMDAVRRAYAGTASEAEKTLKAASAMSQIQLGDAMRKAAADLKSAQDEFANYVVWQLGDTSGARARLQELVDAVEAGALPAAAFKRALDDIAAADASMANSRGLLDMASGSSAMAYSLSASTLITTVALFNVQASTATVTVRAPDNTLISSVTMQLQDVEAIADWHSYFFDPVAAKSEVIFDDLAGYPGNKVVVSLDAPGGSPRVGQIVAGRAFLLGELSEDATIGIQDYSRKERDDWGNPEIIERPFSLRGDFDLAIQSSRVRTVQKTLSSVRARPAVYYETEGNSDVMIYGYFSDFSITLKVGEISFMSLEVEGLV